MTIPRTAIAVSLALTAAALALPSFAQADAGTCILAGRLSDEARWAPRMAGVQLLGQDGKAVTSADKQALSAVKQVRLSAPALLSRCDGNAELTVGGDTPLTKSAVPAAKAGPGLLAVESVNFPKLRRGGEMVELKVTVPAERVVMITR